jgi:hypothetical protein
MKSLARERDRSEILQRLKALDGDRPRRWGRMSAPQMVCHLLDAFHMMAGEKQVSDASTLASRTIIKFVALYVPAHWPQGIPTVREVDQEYGGRKPAQFAADLAQVATLVENVTRHTAGLHGRVHPIFGSLSERAWMRWAYLHTDHHLRQFGA